MKSQKWASNKKLTEMTQMIFFLKNQIKHLEIKIELLEENPQ